MKYHTFDEHGYTSTEDAMDMGEAACQHVQSLEATNCEFTAQETPILVTVFTDARLAVHTFEVRGEPEHVMHYESRLVSGEEA